MTTIYLAGAIDFSVSMIDWKTTLVNFLEEIGVAACFFDPATAYKQSCWGEPNLARTRYIEDINKDALEQASIFVVCLQKGVTTIGTPIELDWAYQLAKPIILLTDIKPGSSVYLDNRINTLNWIQTEFNTPTSIQAGVLRVADRIGDLRRAGATS